MILKRWFYAFLCFIYVIGPIIQTPLGLYGDPILIISVLLSVYLFCAKFDKKFAPRFFIGVFEWPLIVLQLYIVLPFLNCFLFPDYGYSAELSDIIRPLRIILTIYSGIALVLIARRVYGMNFFSKLLKILVFTMFLNSLVMSCQVMSEPFRDFMDGILYRIDDGVNRLGLELRASGLYLSGGALPSVFQTIVTVFIPYLIAKKELNYCLGLLLALFLFIVSIFTGRSGLLVSVPFLYSSFLFLKRNQIVRMFVIIGLSIFSFISYIGLFESEAFIYGIERFSWLTNQSKDSGAISEILSKLSVPKDWFVCLFGVLNFNNALYTHVSDMGFNIKWWTYGIVGWIFYYWPYWKMMLYVYCSKVHKLVAERKVVFIFLMTYLLFEFKENMMYARNGMSLLTLVIYGYVVYRRQMMLLCEQEK